MNVSPQHPWLEKDRTWMLLIILQVLACWPVWRWWMARLSDGSGDSWALSSWMLTLGWVLCYRHRASFRSETPRLNGPLLLPSIFMLIYALSFPFVPALVSGLLAIVALSMSLSVYFMGSRIGLALCALLILGLPLEASVQFYLGYPLRVMVAEIAVKMIGLSGFAVVREGAGLAWGKVLVQVDAPCSGIKMLWAGSLLTCLLTFYYRLNTKAFVLAICGAAGALILANGFRASALFYIEAGVIEAPAWAHSGVGLIVFLGLSVFIVWSIDCISRWMGTVKNVDAAHSLSSVGV